MKKKVLLISESMGGGLRKHVVQLIENLDRNLFEIYFIHGTETLDESFRSNYQSIEKNSKIIPCNRFVREINMRKDWATYRFISKKIEEIKPDIVHCHSSKAGVIGRIAAKRLKVEKIFYTPHAYSFLAPEFSERKKKFFTIIERLLSRTCTTKTFNVSIGEMEEAINRKIDKKNKFEVIYNGLPLVELPDKEAVKKELGLEANNVVVGNNARMSKQKNPMEFVQIAKKVISQNSNYHFVWAGDGPLINEIKTKICNYGLNDNIHLIGDRNDSEFIVAGYDVFLITSLYEGLPYAPIEAMRAGVPIVATDVVGNKEIISKKNGYLFDLSDVENAAKQIISIQENIKFRKEEVKNCFREKFFLNTMINRIEEFYNN